MSNRRMNGAEIHGLAGPPDFMDLRLRRHSFQRTSPELAEARTTVLSVTLPSTVRAMRLLAFKDCQATRLHGMSL